MITNVVPDSCSSNETPKNQCFFLGPEAPHPEKVTNRPLFDTALQTSEKRCRMINHY
jgi:hypothetical protein